MKLSQPLADKICRLIPSLASTFDGEVIATRNAIGRELAAGRKDWFDLATAISEVSSDAGMPKAAPTPPHMFGDLARACRDLDGGRLSARERTFVDQMCRLGFSRSPSSCQADWLASIFARLQRRTAA